MIESCLGGEKTKKVEVQKEMWKKPHLQLLDAKQVEQYIYANARSDTGGGGCTCNAFEGGGCWRYYFA